MKGEIFMGNGVKDKVVTSVIVFVLLDFIVFGVCFFKPAGLGKAEVIKNAIQYGSAIILGSAIIAMGVLVAKKKIIYFIMMLFLGGGTVLVGIGFFSNAVRGLYAGPKKIVNENYEVKYRNSRRGPDKYWIEVDTGRKYVRIYIDEITYQHLRNSKPNIEISYYPYINIADEILYK